MMADRLDDILKQALTPTEEPAEALNQTVLRRIREEERAMKEFKMEKIEKNQGIRRMPAAAIAAAAVLGLGSVTAVAAARLLAPAQVTQQLGDKSLTDSFQGENAVTRGETQSFGGYDVTFLGITAGDGISDYVTHVNGQLRADRSYIVLSIANSDGTPMPETSSEDYDLTAFLATPLIQGCDPVWYNVFAFGGYMTETVVDGVRYRMVECDNVEVFADRELYLAVLDNGFYDKEAYVYDAESGRIARNEGYRGLNALFRLPIDASRADSEAAGAYLEQWSADAGAGVVAHGPAGAAKDTAGRTGTESLADTDEAFEQMMRERLGEGYEEWKAVEEWMARITPQTIEQYTVPVESTRQVLKPDAEGYISCGSWEVENRGGGHGGRFNVKELFEGADAEHPVVLGTVSASGTMDSVILTSFTRNADGTVTFVAHIPGEDQ